MKRLALLLPCLTCARNDRLPDGLLFGAANKLHTNALRLSIEWSRVFPVSTIGVTDLRSVASTDALAYYHALFAAMKARGLTPLCHPQPAPRRTKVSVTLRETRRAMDRGAGVRGYFYWTLTVKPRHGHQARAVRRRTGGSGEGARAASKGHQGAGGRRADPARAVAQVEREYRKIRYQTLIVDDARKKQGRDGDPELTYGTTPPRLALRILALLEAGPRDIFYDLGCGLGVPTVVAALVCRKATGIDVLPQVLEHGRAVARALSLRNASFAACDFREADLRDGTVFYSYSTCFSAETRAAMAERIARARRGARIATVTHALQHPALRFVKRVDLRWGVVKHAIFLHVRS